jgi:hypothetical protein
MFVLGRRKLSAVPDSTVSTATPTTAIPDTSVSQRPVPYKHPFLKIHKPSKEEIQRSKERQTRRNLTQYGPFEPSAPYTDTLTNKSLGLKSSLLYQNHSHHLAKNRFMQKRSQLYSNKMAFVPVAPSTAVPHFRPKIVPAPGI